MKQKPYVFAAAAILLSGYSVAAGYLSIPEMSSRIILLTLALVLIYGNYYDTTEDSRRGILNYILICVSLVAGMYLLLEWEPIVHTRMGLLTRADMLVAAILVVLVALGALRTVGKPITIIALLFLMYAFFGHHIPGALGYPKVPLERLAFTISLYSEGIFGVALTAAAKWIVLFIVLGKFLELCGAGEFFNDIALSVLGGSRGGPAKGSVLASAAFGTISGAPAANVAATGAVTIPLMKSIGYKSHFAAAVEAVASTGGQIMPPIMGAAAFIMPEYLGIPYQRVLTAAIMPAVLFYVAVFRMVDLEAERLGLVGLPREELPSFTETIKKGAISLLPLVVFLVLFIAVRTTLRRAAFYSIMSSWALILFNLRKEIAQNYIEGLKCFINTVIKGLHDSAEQITKLVVICACAGIIVGSLTATGLGLKLSSLLINMAGGNMWLLLIFAAIASLVLGLGVTATAVYILVATLIAPALTNMGIEPLAGHLFVFYFAIICGITPPVALNAFVAASMAEADFWKTGITAFLLGSAAYIVPFVFVRSPQLLGYGTVYTISYAFITAVIGVVILASACVGCGWGFKFNPLSRILLLLASICMMGFGYQTDLIGLFLVAVVVCYSLWLKKKYHGEEVQGESAI